MDASVKALALRVKRKCPSDKERTFGGEGAGAFVFVYVCEREIGWSCKSTPQAADMLLAHTHARLDLFLEVMYFPGVYI